MQVRIIEQDVVRITGRTPIEDLVNKAKGPGKNCSFAVQKHIERKILAYKNKTVIFS